MFKTMFAVAVVLALAGCGGSSSHGGAPVFASQAQPTMPGTFGSTTFGNAKFQ